jgi:phage-related protein
MAGEVASAFVTLIPSARGFRSGIERQIGGDVTAAGKSSGRKFGSGMVAGIGGSLKGVAGPLAAAFAGVQAFGFFRDAVTGASDLEESGNKLAAIFGAATPAVEKFANQGAQALGQNAVAVRDAAATFGIFGKAAGLSGKGLVSFSTDLTSLSTDLASFFNTSPEDAVEAIGAALRGESEPIRRYGVLLDDATLRARALQLGLIDSVKQGLTPQQKALAAQAEIMAQTKDAQGDFQRTSGGLANQQRILAAQWTNMKTQLGTALLPAMTAVVSFLNTNLVPAFDAISGVVGPFVERIKAAFSGGGTTGGAAAFASAFTTIKNAALTLQPVLAAIGQKFMAVLGPAIRTIGGLITTQLIPAFNRFVPAIMPIVKFLVNVLGSTLIGIFNGAVNVIKGAVKIISGILNLVASLLTGKWGAAWAAVKQIFSGAFTFIKGIVQVLWNVGILRVFRLGFTLIKGLVMAGWNFLKGLFTRGARNLVGILVTLPARFRAIFTSMWNAAKSLGGNIVRGIVSGVRSLAGAVKDALLGLLPGPLKKFAGMLGISSPSKVFEGFGQSIGQGFVLGVEAQRSAVESSVRRLAAVSSAAGRVSTAGVTAGRTVVVNNHYPAPERASDSLAMTLRQAEWAMAGAFG